MKSKIGQVLLFSVCTDETVNISRRLSNCFFILTSFLLRSRLGRKIMDDDVIDLSSLTEEDRREHFRRLDQLTTCPCCYCTKICDRVDIMANCAPYQAWLDYQTPRRNA